MSWKCRWGSVELPELPQAASCWPGGHPAARPDPERAAAQVGQGGVDPVAQVEDEVVAEDPPGPEELADRPLGDQVEQGRR
jgi:hypothetical protein